MRHLVPSLLLLTVFSGLRAEETPGRNWPTWRGPTGNGVALHGTPPLTWDDKTNIRWKAEIPGEGFSTPIIWGNRLFVLSAVPKGEGERPEFDFTVTCLNRADGAVAWRRVVRTARPHEGRHQTNTYASGSPVTDGRHLWASFGSFGLHCLDLDGNVTWSKDLGPMRTRNEFGEASSPAVHDGLVYLVRDTEDESRIHAFDALTGAEKWSQPRAEKTSWTTPVVLTHAGRTQVVVNGTGAVRSYDAKTGEVIWSCSGQTVNAVPTIVADADTVYAMSGFRGNAAMAIELGRTGDLTGTSAVRWKLDRGTPYVPSPLLADGTLWFYQLHSGIFNCVDARTGKVHYQQERLPTLTSAYASPVAAAGRIYLAGRDGVTLVLEQSTTLKVLATNVLDDAFNASPAVVGDALYLRGRNHVYCLAAP